MDQGVQEEPDVPEPLVLADYQRLADFRFHVRRFFEFADESTEQAGVAPAQFQAMLAIRAHDGAAPMTITQLAERLLTKVNSTVELVQRLQHAGLVDRARSDADRRRIELKLTAKGEDLVERLTALQLREHRRNLPELERIVAELGKY
ncbi:MAG TPA: MarR family winged helix-turn-helix transcriptional regulator [Sphingomonas sp.]